MIVQININCLRNKDFKKTLNIVYNFDNNSNITKQCYLVMEVKK